MGRAGLVSFGDLTIAGYSGIFKQRYFRKDIPRKISFPKNLYDVYPTRVEDMEKLRKIGKVDVMMSHDWPRGI